MDPDYDAGRVLEQLDVLRHPSDLDLLIFFARHPRALLSSEHLTAFLGYGAKEIAASLDLLLEAGILSRSSHTRHAARMYVFAAAPPHDVWLPGLRQLAVTREGRLALISALRRKSGTDAANQAGPAAKHAGTRPLPFPRGRMSADDAPRRPDARPDAAPGQSHQHGGQGGER